MKAKPVPISELTTPPIPGRPYIVPVIQVDYDYTGNLIWLPVIGPKHADAEIIGFPSEHYHYDWRFMPERIFAEIKHAQEESRVYGHVCNSDRVRGISEAVRICRRTVVAFPTELNQDWKSEPDPIPWLAALENAYGGHTLKSCRVCPHRGFALASEPIRNGLIICPGHGLAWSAKTGALVKRCKGGK